MEWVWQVLSDQLQVVVILNVDGALKRGGCLTLRIINQSSPAWVIYVGVDEPTLSLEQLAI